MQHPFRLATGVLAIALALGLTGCVVAQPVHGPGSDGTIGALAPGFLGSNPTPSPEATITPAPGSWDEVEPTSDFRLAIITADTDPTADELANGVLQWGTDRGLHVERWSARDDDEIEHLIVEASEGRRPVDLVVGAGAGVVDVFALITSQHLAQEFLVIGAQLPEPTANVTAVIWEGAAFRGSGISDPTASDRPAATAERAEIATHAGVASVLHGYTGIVLDLGD